MTREELKEHCERQVQHFERVEKIMPVTPNDWKRYEEHKLILELLEPEPCEDVIDRAEAMTEIMMFAENMKFDEEDIYIKVSDAVQLLRELPSVNPQEPCDDAVNRQAVLNTLDNMDKALNEDRTVENYKELLKECYEVLPSVTPQPTRWIPVSERLPEIQQVVLLSLRSLNVEVGFRAKTEPYFYCHNAGSCYIEPQNVLAWQPLPKAYKESD